LRGLGGGGSSACRRAWSKCWRRLCDGSARRRRSTAVRSDLTRAVDQSVMQPGGSLLLPIYLRDLRSSWRVHEDGWSVGCSGWAGVNVISPRTNKQGVKGLSRVATVSMYPRLHAHPIGQFDRTSPWDRCVSICYLY
jgi:hypothetical protein